jgi:cellulose synthase/poly-beta-1,6-N-acetylglucosamine synthase-like glycosyltransferase
MFDLIFIPVALIYLTVVGSLFVFGVNFFYLTYLSLKKQPQEIAPPPVTKLPRVTVQLPIYNELYVAERLLTAAARLDYPPELLEIQVLDDSTDETVEIIASVAGGLRSQGVNIIHQHRSIRTGFKAGALAHGLQAATGEFLAIFDADFIPHPDFLKRTIPYFNDPQVGFVQARWGHVNQDYSLLTRLQSLSIDAHFMVEQFARSRAGYWFNFNGTAGVWRRKTIEDVGGWTADTLTEDLDLSYRSFLKGWRGVYLKDVEVPAELPVSFSAYRRQQQRWARGSLECALKFIPTVYSTNLPLAYKIQATLHLLGYGVHLLLFGLSILYPIVIFLSLRFSNLVSLFGIGLFFNLTAFAPTVFFLVAQERLGYRWWQKLWLVLSITVLGNGMMLNTMRAIFEIVLNKKSAFERTPKFGITKRKENWTRRRYQLKLDPIVYFEISFGLLNLTTIYLALIHHNWAIAVYAAIFCTGLLFTSGTTLLQTFAVVRESHSNR